LIAARLGRVEFFFGHCAHVGIDIFEHRLCGADVVERLLIGLKAVDHRRELRVFAGQLAVTILIANDVPVTQQCADFMRAFGEIFEL